MKNVLVLLVLLLVSMHIEAQKRHLDQSEPFENVLLALKTDSISLFKNAFSKSVKNEEDNYEDWNAKLTEGKEKFKEKFGDFKLKSFSYAFNGQDSKLVIYFKKEEMFSIKVIYEDNVWKLDEH